jgi:hypothetical protein
MTPQDFIKKWKPVALTERATAHEHFIDLCRLFDHPTPIEDDPVGDHFTFEKGAPKTGGGEGWADVWKKGSFAWEYKKKKRDLGKALEQLTRYAAALENPPLQVTPTAAPGEAPRRYPDRILPKTAEAAVKLKERTLTKLYNERPRWLADAHDALDRAVAAAYGWPEDIATEDALARLLALNLERARVQER